MASEDEGSVLTFDESKKYIPQIRRDGIIQFLHLLKKFKADQTDDCVWGDETEFHVVHVDQATKKVRLSCNQPDIIKKIKEKEFEAQEEYGSWMIEATPQKTCKINCCPETLLENLVARQEGLKKYLEPNEHILPLPVFPLLGVGDFFCYKNHTAAPIKVDDSMNSTSDHTEEQKSPCTKSKEEQNKLSHSRFIDDSIINKNPRFVNITRNIYLRKKKKVCVKIPLYKDEKTSADVTDDEPYPGFIYMDSSAFGMGNCCLQQTFGCHDYESARYLTDQLAVIAPLMLALTASSSVFKGKIADTDTRWSATAQAVDCRTDEESDPNHANYIPKSRYDSISFYISNDPACKPEYNDYKFPVNEDAKSYAKAKAAEMGVELDEAMLHHLGFVFIRDPLVVFADEINLENDKCTDHFENFQSTNWNSVRFKPPPSFDGKIKWRVELRTCELQIRQEENAAFSIFAMLLVVLIRHYKLNFYIPMTKLQENFDRSLKKDAVIKEKFWFRKTIDYDGPDEYVELSIHEFLVGKENEYKGVIPLMEEYFNECESQKGFMTHVKEYFTGVSPGKEFFSSVYKKFLLENIIKRATGENPTPARWIRDFVLRHPAYKKDSIVDSDMAFDLISALLHIVKGEKSYTDFK